jgi:hypothetical protein
LVSPEDLRPLSPRCAEARVLGLEPRGPTTDRRGLPLTLRVASDADCPLVLATNYAEALEAWGRASSTQESPQRLRTFPAYGALLGVLVPAGVREVEVRPRPWPPPFTLGLAVVGGLLLGVAAVGRPARLRSGR